MDPGRYPLKHWVDLLLSSSEMGVSRLHCSDEYESFPFLLKVLSAVRSARPGFSWEFVVKLAEPHFGVAGFDATRFKARLDSYREALRVDRIDCVQWMWRGDLKDESERLRGFASAADVFARAVEEAKSIGAVRRICCFPYTATFADMALDDPSVDGIAVYRNPLELEFEPVVAKSHQLGKQVLVIRPFKAGEALPAGGVGDLIAFSARVPSVAGIVVSCSTVVHLTQCIEGAAGC
jgi:hypothetical protein